VEAAIISGYHAAVVEGLSPGAYLIALGGVELAIRVRQEGLHLRDSFAVFFPGPEFRSAFLFRKPIGEEDFYEHLIDTRMGSLHIDGCRVPGIAQVPWGKIRAYRAFHDPSYDGPAFMDAPPANPLGRWPTNVGFVHGPRCRRGRETIPEWECEPGCPVPFLDGQSGDRTSGTGAVKRETGAGHKGPTYSGPESRVVGTPMIAYGDTGGASRFYLQFATPQELLDWMRTLITPPGGACDVRLSGVDGSP
jgi:hypothetical protein